MRKILWIKDLNMMSDLCHREKKNHAQSILKKQNKKLEEQKRLGHLKSREAFYALKL